MWTVLYCSRREFLDAEVLPSWDLQTVLKTIKWAWLNLGFLRSRSHSRNCFEYIVGRKATKICFSLSLRIWTDIKEKTFQVGRSEKIDICKSLEGIKSLYFWGSGVKEKWINPPGAQRHLGKKASEAWRWWWSKVTRINFQRGKKWNKIRNSEEPEMVCNPQCSSYSTSARINCINTYTVRKLTASLPSFSRGALPQQGKKKGIICSQYGKFWLENKPHEEQQDPHSKEAI